MTLDRPSEGASLNARGTSDELDRFIQNTLGELAYSSEPGYQLLRTFALFEHALLTVVSHKEDEVSIRKLLQEQQHLFANDKLYNDIDVAIDVRNEVAHVVDREQPSVDQMDRATVSFLQAIEVIRPTTTNAIQKYFNGRVLDQQSFPRPTRTVAPSCSSTSVSAKTIPGKSKAGVDNPRRKNVLLAIAVTVVGTALAVWYPRLFEQHPFIALLAALVPALLVSSEMIPRLADLPRVGGYGIVAFAAKTVDAMVASLFLLYTVCAFLVSMAGIFLSMVLLVTAYFSDSSHRSVLDDWKIFIMGLLGVFVIWRQFGKQS